MTFPSIKNIEGQVIDDFQIMERCSGGAFSVVHFAHHIPTDTYCVAKIIDLSVQNTQNLSSILREISVFTQVNHPHIVSLYRFSFVEPLLFFFMEYLPNGTLLKYVTSKHGLDEAEARKLFIQLYSAIRHLHIYHFLAHRDIKLENVLLDKNNNIKVIDFGLSSTFYNNMFKTMVGTPGYMPPEIIAGNQYTEKCDVWSLGISLYSMVTSSLPFTIQSHSAKRLLQECESFECPKYISPLCSDLIMKMLSPKPDYRPTLLQLQNHPWMTGIPPITGLVVPSPVQFYNIKSYTAILKFKRHSVDADPLFLSTCEKEYQLDSEKLKMDLADGIVNDATTIYFILLSSTKKRPNLPELKFLFNSLSKDNFQLRNFAQTPRIMKRRDNNGAVVKKIAGVKPSKSSPPTGIRFTPRRKAIY